MIYKFAMDPLVLMVCSVAYAGYVLFIDTETKQEATAYEAIISKKRKASKGTREDDQRGKGLKENEKSSSHHEDVNLKIAT